MVVQGEGRSIDIVIEGGEVIDDAERPPVWAWHRKYFGLVAGLVCHRIYDTPVHPILYRTIGG